MKSQTKELGKEKKGGMISKKMTRKEALQKTGYIAATTMMILLGTSKAAHASPPGNTPPAAPKRWDGS